MTLSTRSQSNSKDSYTKPDLANLLTQELSDTVRERHYGHSRPERCRSASRGLSASLPPCPIPDGSSRLRLCGALLLILIPILPSPYVGQS